MMRQHRMGVFGVEGFRSIAEVTAELPVPQKCR